MDLAFSGCRNLDVTATDTPDLSNATSMFNMFADCTSLVGTSAFNNWEVSTITDMLALFFNARLFNQDISNWNVSAVETMEYMFMFADNFNQNISGWNVASVTSMKDMFNSATDFDQDLGNWDISSLLTAEDMFANTGLSLENYDNTLIGWATLDTGEIQIPTNVSFAGGSSQYCASETQRQDLIDTYGWSITDAGINCPTTTIYVVPYVYLQGAALNPNPGEENLMRDDLRAAGLLPTTSPYGDGATVDASVFDTTGNNAIVDWVWVELRDKDDNTLIVAEKSAFVLRNGDVLGTDLTALSFDLAIDNYYVAIKHRNHLGIMSASTISLFDSPLVVDFTDGSVATYGTNAQTTFGMPSGIQGMWAGDANGDGKVNIIGAPNDANTLRDAILNDPINLVIQFYGFTVSGYTNEDVNLSGGANIIGVNNDANVLRDDILNHPINEILQFYGYNILEQLPTVVPDARMIFDIEMTKKNKQFQNKN